MTKFDRLPKEIQEKMLDYQEQQGNERDAWVFRKELEADAEQGGFDWDETPEGKPFWYVVLMYENYDRFFEHYPKQGTGFEPLPEKVMNVWDKEDKEKYKRVVFGRKNGKYIAWNSGTTEEANIGFSWDYAEEIPQEEAGGAEEEIDIDGKKFSKSTIKEALKNYINN